MRYKEYKEAYYDIDLKRYVLKEESAEVHAVQQTTSLLFSTLCGKVVGKDTFWRKADGEVTTCAPCLEELTKDIVHISTQSGLQDEN
jgi:hypothetical protein